MNYSEMVQRVLAAKQADIEMGLARAREHKTFVETVSRLLDKTMWGYTARMDGRFCVTFVLEAAANFRHQQQAVRQTLEECCEVYEGGADAFDVYSKLSDGLFCRVVIGDVPQ